MKKIHPDVPVACDTATPYAESNIMPSNADIYNFHSYYAVYKKATELFLK